MNYNVDEMRRSINNSEIVKRLISGPEFVGEYPKTAPTKQGGYIPYVGKIPMIAFKPFPYKEPEISDESKIQYNCALSFTDMDLMKGVIIR